MSSLVESQHRPAGARCAGDCVGSTGSRVGARRNGGISGRHYSGAVSRRGSRAEDHPSASRSCNHKNLSESISNITSYCRLRRGLAVGGDADLGSFHAGLVVGLHNNPSEIIVEDDNLDRP